MGPALTMRPCFSSRAWVKPGGISSTWWVTRTIAGAPSAVASSAEGADQVFATRKVQTGRRLVEEHQLGVRHQGPGDLDALALTLGQGAEGAVAEVTDTESVSSSLAR